MSWELWAAYIEFLCTNVPNTGVKAATSSLIQRRAATLRFSPIVRSYRRHSNAAGACNGHNSHTSSGLISSGRNTVRGSTTVGALGTTGVVDGGGLTTSHAARTFEKPVVGVPAAWMHSGLTKHHLDTTRSFIHTTKSNPRQSKGNINAQQLRREYFGDGRSVSHDSHGKPNKRSRPSMQLISGMKGATTRTRTTTGATGRGTVARRARQHDVERIHRRSSNPLRRSASTRAHLQSYSTPNRSESQTMRVNLSRHSIADKSSGIWPPTARDRPVIAPKPAQLSANVSQTYAIRPTSAPSAGKRFCDSRGRTISSNTAFHRSRSHKYYVSCSTEVFVWSHWSSFYFRILVARFPQEQ